MDNVLSHETFAMYFSCFSGHMIMYKGIFYPTSEHAYHCQRYADKSIIDEIQKATSAYYARELSQKYKSQQIPDFDSKKVEVMEGIFKAKLDQHEDVKKALIESENKIIIKNHPDDYYWGNGADGSGKNEMGKIWMKLRSEMK